MIVDDFDIIRVTISESKAYTPRAVDGDCPLAAASTFERMQTNTLQSRDLIESRNRVKLGQPAKGTGNI
jgi:hypothetical protein